MSERQAEFTHCRRVRVAMGTWNVNGGKQFRSNLLGTAELAEWLLDVPVLEGGPESQGESLQFLIPVVLVLIRVSRLPDTLGPQGIVSVEPTAWLQCHQPYTLVVFPYTWLCTGTPHTIMELEFPGGTTKHGWLRASNLRPRVIQLWTSQYL